MNSKQWTVKWSYMKMDFTTTGSYSPRVSKAVVYEFYSLYGAIYIRRSSQALLQTCNCLIDPRHMRQIRCILHHVHQHTAPITMQTRSQSVSRLNWPIALTSLLKTRIKHKTSTYISVIVFPAYISSYYLHRPYPNLRLLTASPVAHYHPSSLCIMPSRKTPQRHWHSSS